MRKIDASKKITLGAMVTALTVLMLYAASVLPAGKLACYFIASLFVYMLSSEGLYGTALLSYLASSLLAFLIVSDKLMLLPFFALFGHFGIFKAFLQTHAKDRVVRFLSYLIYCTAFTSIGAVAAFYIMGFDILTNIPFNLPLYAAVLILEALFAVYVALYTIGQRFYESRIRQSLMPRK